MRRIILGLLASLLVASVLPSRANELELMAMAPDHVGLTVQKSPVLYYYISHATSLPIRFTLIDHRKVLPVGEFSLESPTRAGFWGIRIEDYQVVLEPDVQYRWFISIVQNPVSHSEDIVAGGIIERCSIEDCLVVDIPSNCDRNLVTTLAKNGIWYDAVSCLCDLIRSNPDDKTLRRLLHDLLRPAGLLKLDDPYLIPLKGRAEQEWKRTPSFN
jgi:hypothetical protein